MRFGKMIYLYTIDGDSKVFRKGSSSNKQSMYCLKRLENERGKNYNYPDHFAIFSFIELVKITGKTQT